MYTIQRFRCNPCGHDKDQMDQARHNMFLNLHSSRQLHSAGQHNQGKKFDNGDDNGNEDPEPDPNPPSPPSGEPEEEPEEPIEIIPNPPPFGQVGGEAKILQYSPGIPSMSEIICKQCGGKIILDPITYVNDVGIKCEKCQAINTITLVMGELKKQVQYYNRLTKIANIAIVVMVNTPAREYIWLPITASIS